MASNDLMDDLKVEDELDDGSLIRRNIERQIEFKPTPQQHSTFDAFDDNDTDTTTGKSNELDELYIFFSGNII